MTEIIDFGATRISDYVQACLAAVVDAAGEIGISLPSRQVAGVGLIPSDCEQVVATLIQATTGAPESIGVPSATGTYPTPDANMTFYQVTVNLVITRATATNFQGDRGTTPPDPAAYLSNLTTASGDTAVLLNAINALQEANPMSAITRVITAGSPQGGLFSTTARITATV